MVAQPVAAQPAPTAVPATARAPTPEEADEFCRQWQALKARQAQQH
jgi:hypothetical protein